MSELRDYINEQLKDQEFKKEWDNLEVEKINNISPRGSSWGDFERQMYTPEEIAESKKRREIIEKLFSENHSDFFIDTIKGLFEAAEIKLGRSLTATEMQNIINKESIT